MQRCSLIRGLLRHLSMCVAECSHLDCLKMMQHYEKALKTSNVFNMLLSVYIHDWYYI